MNRRVAYCVVYIHIRGRGGGGGTVGGTWAAAGFDGHFDGFDFEPLGRGPETAAPIFDGFDGGGSG